MGVVLNSIGGGCVEFGNVCFTSGRLAVCVVRTTKSSPLNTHHWSIPTGNKGTGEGGGGGL